jgi:hypothetical protein
MSPSSKGRMLLNEKAFRDHGSGLTLRLVLKNKII